MAASRLHGLPCGEEAGARNLPFGCTTWIERFVRNLYARKASVWTLHNT